MNPNQDEEKNLISKSKSGSTKYVSPFKIFELLKKQKLQRKKTLNGEPEEIHPLDELISNLTKDNKILKTIDYSDEKNVEKLYLQKEKQCILNNQKIAFEDVVYHALAKNKKMKMIY